MSIHEADELCRLPYCSHSVLVSSTSRFSAGHGKSMCKVPDLFRMPALKHEAELEEV